MAGQERGRDPASHLSLCSGSKLPVRAFIYRRTLTDSQSLSHPRDFSGRTPIGDDRALVLSFSSTSYTCHGC